MTAEEWIAAFATSSGAEQPSKEEIDELLKLAAVAAHSSERIAAPIACWITGRAGLGLDEAQELAAEIGSREDLGSVRRG